MTADPFVGGSLDQQELAQQPARLQPVPPQGERPRPRQHHQVEKRRELLMNQPDLVVRGNGNSATAARFKPRQHSPQPAVAKPCVGIQKQHQISRRRPRALMTRPRLPSPPLGQGL